MAARRKHSACDFLALALTHPVVYGTIITCCDVQLFTMVESHNNAGCFFMLTQNGLCLCLGSPAVVLEEGHAADVLL